MVKYFAFGKAKDRLQVGFSATQRCDWLELQLFPSLQSRKASRINRQNLVTSYSNINSRDHIRPIMASLLYIDILIQELLVSSSCNTSINQ